MAKGNGRMSVMRFFEASLNYLYPSTSGSIYVTSASRYDDVYAVVIFLPI